MSPHNHPDADLIATIVKVRAVRRELEQTSDVVQQRYLAQRLLIACEECARVLAERVQRQPNTPHLSQE